MNRSFELPPIIEDLVKARNALRDHYRASGLSFTLDGNLLGDLGEALAAELFGIVLVGRSVTGIDGHASDGRSVQVKASASGRGAAFRMVETRADHLIFFSLDVETLTGIVDFNGPEAMAVKRLPASWVGQRSLTLGQLRAADREVADIDRLEMIR
ncbi:hypothetical protein GCM10011390_18760 [Aureimonas endophytica]|uniref:DUF6998 domain-containing protein n=1 Tax=Aureimonas endophytica TaxID=2027858 RepID=A0A916ZJX8_9HYPH|nr:hypothetical protein [Aureimonas endophytica]GGE00205.1 hypothetical protein GCM10011390_18760 [Aureimonas endophytica]